MPVAMACGCSIDLDGSFGLVDRAWCRRLRNDRGYWLELEEFLEQAGEITVTHSICPECRGRHFAQSDRSQAKAPGGSGQS